MKKLNSKKGLATLMTVVMGVSMFVASGAGTTMGMFRSNNNSLDSQCNERSQAFGSIRDQRRQAMMGARRELNNSNFSIGVTDFLSSFINSSTANAKEIKEIILTVLKNKNINIPGSVVKTIADKLDGLGFSSVTILNMLVKAESAFTSSNMTPIEFLSFNQANYTLYAEEIFSGRLDANGLINNLSNSALLFKDMLINTFYKNDNGVYVQRTENEARLVFDNTIGFCNYLTTINFAN